MDSPAYHRAMGEHELNQAAEALGENWERRAKSDARDFYVASHPGWTQEQAWKQQARLDVGLILTGLEPEVTRDWSVLEIGCGVGRLAAGLRKRVASYDGIDIAPSMVEEARRRNEHIPGIRFFQTDGVHPPEPIAQNKYDLVVSWAVLIHCPREIVEANLKHGFEMLAPGGQMRFEVRADPTDPEGIVAFDSPQHLHGEMPGVEDMREEERAITDGAMRALQNEYYMGAMFTYAELGPLIEGLTGGEVTLLRADPASIYGWITKPA